tara:strand:- start:3348 stop:5096 length:1749 start_codon:yes stop_codon:yes gene_type:complete
MNLDRINKATTDLQAQDYTTAESARQQILGDIDVETAQRKEESRERTNVIMSDPNLSQADFNAAALKHTQEGFADTGGVLKQRANEFARNTDTGITEDFITSYVDPENNESYTRATYNTLVNDTYNKLKEAHPFADESVLRKQAKAAITRTEAGTLFEEQGWYEKLTPDKKDVRDESIRKQAVVKTWREGSKALTKSFEALKKKRTPENSEQFRSDLRELNRQMEENPDSLGPSAKARLTTWTQRAITDYTQNSFDPEEAYLKQFGGKTRMVEDADGNLRQETIPLGLDDYSPTNVRDFVDAQIQTLTDELPFADRREIIKQVGTKIQTSGLAVRFASGALPAKLKALAEQHRYDDEVARVERRSTILKGITKSGGVAEYAFDTLFEKFQKRGVKLDEEQVGKLTKQLKQTVNNWKGFIPNWDKLHKDTQKTYSIAIGEILSRANLDKDSNFLWLDPDDFPLSGVGSTTGDMTGIKKNAALTAILGHINPYGGSADKTSGGRTNMQIISDLQGIIVKDNTKKSTALVKTSKTKRKDVSKNTKDVLGIDKAASEAAKSTLNFLETQIREFRERYKASLTPAEK